MKSINPKFKKLIGLLIYENFKFYYSPKDAWIHSIELDGSTFVWGLTEARFRGCNGKVERDIYNDSAEEIFTLIKNTEKYHELLKQEGS